MSDSSAPRVKHEFLLVEDLFGEILAGQLRIPKFQRPFVWKPTDMIELFESLRRGYPIGSLLFWETDQVVASSKFVGPIQIREPHPGAVNYVLDGQQRLSTLFGVLRLPAGHPRQPGQAHWQWWLYYDLRSQKFLHLPHKAPAEPHVIPLRALLQTKDFIKESVRMQEALGESAASPLIEEGQILTQQIRGYKITVVRIQGGSLLDSVEIFSRLNTMGSKITKDQMLSALTYKEGGDSFDLAQKLDEIVEDLVPYDMSRIRRLVLYRVFLAAADSEDVYRGEWPDYKKKSAADLSAIALNAKNSLLAAVRFLRENLQVPSDKLLPYSSLLIPLSEFFRHCPEPNESQRGLLKRWFWSTAFSGWFASVNSTSMGEIVDELRRFGKGQIADLRVAPLDDKARPIPGRFDMHSARLRVLLLVMTQRLAPRGAGGEILDGAQLVREHGSGAFVKIFRHGPEETVSNPANRVLFRSQPFTSVRKQLLDVPDDLRDSVLQSHAISGEAFEALKAADATAFVAARMRTLSEAERELMKEMGIPPPDFSSAPEDVEIDTDDDD